MAQNGVLSRLVASLRPGSAVTKGNPVAGRDVVTRTRSMSAASAATPTTYGNYASTSDLVYSCVNVRARNFAQPAVRLMQYRDDGDPVKVLAHPKLEAIANPNRFTTAIRMRRMVQSDLSLWGEAFVVAERNVRGPVPEMWRVRPDRMRVVPDPEAYVAGFVYLAEDGSRIPFLPQDVIWLRYEHPTEEYEGLSPIASVRLHADVRHKGLKANSRVLDDDNILRGVITTEQDVGDEEAEEIIDRFESSLVTGGQGVRNTALLSSGAKYQPVAIAPKDLEWLASSRYSDERICGVFQVPPTFVGIMEHATLANVDAYERIFWSEWGKPEVDWFCAELNLQWLTPEEYEKGLRFEADYSGIVALQEDRTAAVDRDTKSIAAGILTVNEVRAERGLEAVPWGDTWWAPATLIPYGSQPAGELTEDAKALQRKREDRHMDVHLRRLGRDERRTKAELVHVWAQQEEAILGKLKEVAPRDELPFRANG